MSFFDKSFIKTKKGLSEIKYTYQTDKLTFVQGCLYFTAAFLGLVLVIPLGNTIRNFHGGCILGAQIIWDNKVIYPWWQFSCEFILYSNLGINVVMALMLGIFTMMATSPRSSQSTVGTILNWQLSYMLTGLAPIMLLISFVVCLSQLSYAVVISIGFSRFCGWLEQSLRELNSPIQSCASAGSLDWEQFRIRNGYTHGVWGSTFFSSLVVVAIAAWLLFFVWFTQFSCFLYRTCSCCSWDVAEEKRKYDSKAWTVAQRRSRMATPIGTPGGRHTPRTLGGHLAGYPAQPGGPVTMYGQRLPSTGDPYTSKDNSLSQTGYEKYDQEPSRYQPQSYASQSSYQGQTYASREEPVPPHQQQQQHQQQQHQQVPTTYRDDPNAQLQQYYDGQQNYNQSYNQNEDANYPQQRNQSYDTNLGSYEQNEPYNQQYGQQTGFTNYNQQQ